ncbi:MAG: hypothetical protein IAI49_16915, partial [Candidatus Eremiobacteraeota bacterium]|nr:hypothetical protein [Candidatus Eremiobacteraeota bacterium]
AAAPASSPGASAGDPTASLAALFGGTTKPADLIASGSAIRPARVAHFVQLTSQALGAFVAVHGALRGAYVARFAHGSRIVDATAAADGRLETLRFRELLRDPATPNDGIADLQALFAGKSDPNATPQIARFAGDVKNRLGAYQNATWNGDGYYVAKFANRSANVWLGVESGKIDGIYTMER